MITMNRDDSGARPEAPPELWRCDPVFAAPKDLQAGGTWIGVNALGVTACLLNRYDAAPTGRVSRGGIVIEAMRSTTPDAAADQLTSLALLDFSPFTCLLISRDGAVRVDWNGQAATRVALNTQRPLMLTSSSWQYEDVSRRRSALFEARCASEHASADQLAAFHCQSEEAHERWMPMMRREASETKSITRVVLTDRAATMQYWTRANAIACNLSSPESETSVARARGFAEA
ncbi:MAG: NRDE family protein [Alphaproteobacteria bacterium]|nr:NRDE family protein [Alphaproteobacteria bacterium]